MRNPMQKTQSCTKHGVIFLSWETEYYALSIMKPQKEGELLLLTSTALLGTEDEDRF